MLWECGIGRRGVRSRTTAGASAELTRWAALGLTFKSEINVGSRLSEKHRLKRRITKCNTTRGEPSACAKEEANQSELRQGGEAKERFSSLQATTAEKPLRASRAFLKLFYNIR
jgi:hypothetical protein